MSREPDVPLGNSSGYGDDTMRLESIATAYAELLEQGQSIAPDVFAERFPEHGSHLLSLLKSVRWIQLAARDWDNLVSEPAKSLLRAESSIDDAAPATLGDFRLIREVGRGGMGIVYEAEQISLSRRVAVKILAPSSLLNDRHVARFAMESQAAAQLQHPHIVPVYGVGCEAGIYYYSMQLIEGCSPLGVMPPRIAAELGACVADALEHSHQLGIIHRDIKPSNLLVDASNKVWVTDFGLARCRQSDQTTASGAILGTLRYMSPEQANGSSNVDHRTDIYSLGVTLYELLTGRCPFESKDRAAFSFDLASGEPMRMSQLVPGIPQDLETIVHKALSIDPNLRYPTAKAMAEDLQRFKRGDVILARRPTIIDRTSKWLTRNARLVMGAALMWSLISIVAMIAAMRLFKAERQARQALAQTRASLEEADIFFSQAREVVDHFGISLAKELAEIPGADSMRRDVLHDTLRYYRSFMTQVQLNPHRQRDLATTYMKLGGIAEQLEAYSEAIEAYERAETLWQWIAPDDPKRAMCGNMLGLLLNRVGKAEQAEAALRTAVECNARIVSADPMDWDATRHYAVSLTNWSETLTSKTDAKPARSALITALSLQASLMANGQIASLVNRELKIDMSRTLAALAATFRSSDPSASRAYSQSCVDCLQSVAEEFTTSADSSPKTHELRSPGLTRAEVFDDLALALCNHAAILFDAAETSLAVLAATRATEIGCRLCAEKPSALRRLNLAAAYHMLARLQARERQLKEQVKSLQSASKLLAGLVQAHGGVNKYHRQLAAVSYDLFTAAESISEPDIAAVARAEYLSQIRWLSEHEPAQSSQLADLASGFQARPSTWSRASQD